MIRNLLFYCYPVRETIWSWHADRLAERRSVWNGRRLLVLALDERTVREDEVRERFAALEAEIIVCENDPGLAETAHFVDTLALLESQRSDEVTFYAHAKGVTRRGPELDAVRRWSSLMYQACLDFPGLIERRLSGSSTVGCLRWKHQHNQRVGWCWAGTFFWLRHDALFGRSWRKIDQSKYGVEDYPGKQFRIGEGSCLTREQINPLQLYSGGINEKFTKQTLSALSKEEETCIRA